MKVLVTVDLTKIDAGTKQQIERALIARGRFTVDSISESEEVFSLDIPDTALPNADSVADRILRRFQHLLGTDITVTKTNV